MLVEGKKAPAFNLESSEGGKLALKDLKGKWAIVYFYPKDATPGCTIEAQGFRDAAKALKALDAIVVGVSKDSVASHCKFRDKQELNFPLLSDPTGEMIEKYGAWGEKNLYGKKSMGIIRSTVVIGPDGVVRKVFAKVKVAGHVDAVLESIRALR